MNFVPEYLRDKPEDDVEEYTVHPKRAIAQRFSVGARKQFARAPKFVQRRGIAYAIGAGFVNSPNPFSQRRVPLPTGKDQCMFEFDPNITKPHIADQLATKVEQALNDPENGRVELFSKKHGRPLTELSHATILSDINFASDVTIQRRPDSPLHDPSVLLAATSKNSVISNQMDSKEEFSNDVSSAIGDHIAKVVVLGGNCDSWIDNASDLADNRFKIKHIVLKHTMEHPKYAKGKFCKFAKQFACRPQHLVNAITNIAAHTLNTESAMSFIGGVTNTEKLRCAIAKRIKCALRGSILGWIRQYTLHMRKKLRRKAKYVEVDEDSCGLRSARPSDDDEVSSSEEDLSCSEGKHTMQSICNVCDEPKFRCTCHDAPILPTDCYGRIKYNLVPPLPSFRRTRTCAMITSPKQQFDEAVRTNDHATIDRMIGEHAQDVDGWFAKLGKNAQHKYNEAREVGRAVNKKLNPFRRRCTPEDVEVDACGIKKEKKKDEKKEEAEKIGCGSCGGEKKKKDKGKGKKKSIDAQYLVDDSTEPESVKIFERMLARNPTRIRSIVNPSGPSKDAIVLMPHDSHKNIGDFMALGKNGAGPVHDYLRSVTIELPRGANLTGSSALSLDGKHTYTFDDEGYYVNDMPIGEEVSIDYGKNSEDSITVFPSSFFIKQ